MTKLSIPGVTTSARNAPMLEDAACVEATYCILVTVWYYAQGKEPDGQGILTGRSKEVERDLSILDYKPHQ